VAQLGFDIETWTRDLIHHEGGPDNCVRPFTPKTDIAGPYLEQGNDNIWGQKLADNLQRLMSTDCSGISDSWDRAVETHYPRGLNYRGRRGVDHFWLGLRSCFPAAIFKIHHTIGAETALMPPRAAVRWSLDGTHSGTGRFGTASGAPVHIMGITHAEFGPRGIRREWTLIDETAVYKQILLYTGNL
jgi:hypothetical protein